MDASLLEEIYQDLDVNLQALQTAEDFKSTRVCWGGYLSTYGRYWRLGKDIAKSHGGAFQRWWDQKWLILKGDETLNYLFQARNAHQHGLKKVVENRDTNSISIGVGGGHTYIQDLSFDALGRLSGQFFTNCPIPVRVEKAGARLVAVKNRNQIYSPPNFFLGQPLLDNSPRSVAYQAATYIGTMTQEALDLPK